jgi:hypothetical protein
VLELLRERVGKLLIWLRESLRPARAVRRQPNNAIDNVAEIDILAAAPLNAGRCVRVGDSLRIVTDPASGGNSALLAVVPSDRYAGPGIFRCQIDLLDGLVGISAVTANYRIIAERTPGRLGRQQLDIIVPDVRDVAGILVRNGALTGRPSRADLSSVSADRYPAEKLLRIEKSSQQTRTLRLPLRKSANGGRLQDAEPPVVTSVDLDTTSAAAIVVDAWDEMEGRMEQNIADKLAPTLAALRSTGMTIIHAPHDRVIHPLARPIKGETVIPGEFMDGDLVADTLRGAGIRHLLYLGYFSNLCVLRRSLGMLEMHKRGFNTILARDVSIAKETDESIAGEWFHKAAVHFIEINFGATVTAAEIQAAVREASAHAAGNGAKVAAEVAAPLEKNFGA